MIKSDLMSKTNELVVALGVLPTHIKSFRSGDISLHTVMTRIRKIAELSGDVSYLTGFAEGVVQSQEKLEALPNS